MIGCCGILLQSSGVLTLPDVCPAAASWLSFVLELRSNTQRCTPQQILSCTRHLLAFVFDMAGSEVTREIGRRDLMLTQGNFSCFNKDLYMNNGTNEHMDVKGVVCSDEPMEKRVITKLCKAFSIFQLQLAV